MTQIFLKDIYLSFEDLTNAIKDKHKDLNGSYRFFKIVSTFFFVKSWKTLRAIQLLCLNGFAEDAAVLMRSIYEMAVNYVYIAHEPSALNERAKLYCEYDTIQLKNWIDQLNKASRKVGNNWNPPKEITDKINKDFPLIKGNYKDKNKWSGLSLFDMAEKTGLDGYAYDAIYRWTCNLSHTNPRATMNYFSTTENGIAATDGPSSQEDINNIFLHACTYYLMIAGTMNNILQLGCENEVNEADKKLLIWGRQILKSAR